MRCPINILRFSLVGYETGETYLHVLADKSIFYLPKSYQ